MGVGVSVQRVVRGTGTTTAAADETNLDDVGTLSMSGTGDGKTIDSQTGDGASLDEITAGNGHKYSP